MQKVYLVVSFDFSCMHKTYAACLANKSDSRIFSDIEDAKKYLNELVDSFCNHDGQDEYYTLNDLSIEQYIRFPKCCILGNHMLHMIIERELL
jgi:hypothetical protein